MRDIVIERKDWESDFFGLTILELLEWNDIHAVNDAIGQVKYDLLECNLDIKKIKDLMLFEAIGFKTIDSRISFLTLINISDSKFLSSSPKYLIRKYEAADYDQILNMTHEHLTFNDIFISRFKNTKYYPQGSAERYFDAWISNSLSSSASLTVVSEYEGKIVGFFIIENKGLDNGIPVWKGRLTAVDKLHRRKKLHVSMQSKIFELLDCDTFYLDNTTQLSNFPVVKNHISSNRKLQSISLNLIKSNV